nr:MAG TPA: hypothetical protein [Caudoviricetes sp.]
MRSFYFLYKGDLIRMSTETIVKRRQLRKKFFLLFPAAIPVVYVLKGINFILKLVLKKK